MSASVLVGYATRYGSTQEVAETIAATLWPWPLVLLMGWLLGQFPVGYFFNDFLKSITPMGLLVIFVTLPLSVYTAYARDRAG